MTMTAHATVTATLFFFTVLHMGTIVSADPLVLLPGLEADVQAAQTSLSSVVDPGRGFALAIDCHGQNIHADALLSGCETTRSAVLRGSLVHMEPIVLKMMEDLVRHLAPSDPQVLVRVLEAVNRAMITSTWADTPYFFMDLVDMQNRASTIMDLTFGDHLHHHHHHHVRVENFSLAFAALRAASDATVEAVVICTGLPVSSAKTIALNNVTDHEWIWTRRAHLFRPLLDHDHSAWSVVTSSAQVSSSVLRHILDTELGGTSSIAYMNPPEDALIVFTKDGDWLFRSILLMERFHIQVSQAVVDKRDQAYLVHREQLIDAAFLMVK
jgi:hypothetical protein